jgi:hypothetical protein
MALHAGGSSYPRGNWPPAIQSVLDANNLEPAPKFTIRVIVQFKDIVEHGESTIAEFGDYSTGKYCLRIKHAYALNAPITAVKGALGFWKISPMVQVALAKSIALYGAKKLY